MRHYSKFKIFDTKINVNVNTQSDPTFLRLFSNSLDTSLRANFQTSFSLNSKILYLILIGLIPIGIDGIGQIFQFWESTNIMRVVTGLIIGSICGISIGIIIDEIKTFRPFKKTKSN